MEDAEIRSRVVRLLVQEFEIAPELLTDDASLREGLGMDSLDEVDMLVGLEEEFGVLMGEEESREVRTVSDVYRYTVKMLARANG